MHYRLGQARFLIQKELEQLDFSVVQVEEIRIRHLYSGDFTDSHTKVIFVGGSGSGKTNLSIALGMELLRVRFCGIVNLVNLLNRKNCPGKEDEQQSNWGD